MLIRNADGGIDTMMSDENDMTRRISEAISCFPIDSTEMCV